MILLYAGESIGIRLPSFWVAKFEPFMSWSTNRSLRTSPHNYTPTSRSLLSNIIDLIIDVSRTRVSCLKTPFLYACMPKQKRSIAVFARTGVQPRGRMFLSDLSLRWEYCSFDNASRRTIASGDVAVVEKSPTGS